MTNLRYYKNLLEEIEKLPNTEQEWIEAVSKQPSLIKSHPNPSEDVQLAAVKKKGSAIQCIKDPSEAVQIAAVRKYVGALNYISDPSEAVQMAAVKRNPYALNLIKNPSESLLIALAKKKGFDPNDPDNPQNKKRMLIWMLKASKYALQNNSRLDISAGFLAKHLYSYLEKRGIIWPELKAITKSGDVQRFGPTSR